MIIEDAVHRRSEHALARDRKIAGRQNGRGKPSYPFIVINKALGFQSSSFQPQTWQERLYQQAQTVLVRSHQYGNDKFKKDDKFKKLAGKLARRDKKRRVFWEELADGSTQRTLKVSFGAFSKSQFEPSDSKKTTLDDPFLERLFEDNGQLIRLVAEQLTGISGDSLSVNYARRNSPEPMHPLRDIGEFRRGALRYSDVNEILYPQYGHNDDKGPRVPFAQVVSGDLVVLEMEYAPPKSYYLFKEIRDLDDEVVAGIKVSGDLIIKWTGRKQLKKGPVREDFIKTMFTNKTSREINGKESRKIAKVPASGDIYVRVPHRNGHPLPNVHRNGLAKAPREVGGYNPVQKHVGRVAAAFFRP